MTLSHLTLGLSSLAQYFRIHQIAVDGWQTSRQ